MIAWRMILPPTLLVAASMTVLTGCADIIARQQLSEGLLPPVVGPVTELNKSLRDLPLPKSKVAVAVYSYTDQTGQFKPSETTQTLSKAVTQGATSVIIKALQDSGNGGWFTVVERERLDNLLKERRIIQDMRKTYLGEDQLNPQALPPLLFAAILLEGGIIGYDSNLQTGGIGARLLGIGADMKYRLDTITVYLRAVSTKTGQVLASVVTHKTIASVGLQGGVFKFIAVDKILEAEAGFTKNEPEQLAVQQAIEKAVHAMVIEGAEQGLWAFADKAYQSRAIDEYRLQLFSSREQAVARAEAVKAGTTQTAQNTAGENTPKPPVKPFTTAIEQRTPQTPPQPRKAAVSAPPARPAAPPAKAAAAASATTNPTTAELVAVLSAMQTMKGTSEDADVPF